ncbi:hypothetical protein [Treponema saccharophilum]|uniref:Uncharacterized protein n=1 Tax=Treponema saccharophilum DSM 2985 TaxID=907348 RepID=H7EPQ6_9SPIR|nr:hypothetical protein [Treponema saccharophilum]EIC00457.1 hypothetical protein TresaDRAFT_0551 [Treponema saccharophilum DSM 2985]BDC94993.1 hypothetical protein TRSA_00920 [Treponema saccharophilum]
MIVKIVLSVISLSLLVIGFIIDTSTDRQIDYDDKEKRRIIVNQLLHFGVIGILLCISLWGNFEILFRISITLLAIYFIILGIGTFSIPHFSFGVIGIPFCISLWGNFRLLFVISSIAVIIAVIVVVVFLIRKFLKEKEKKSKRAFAVYDIEELGEDVLMTAYFFIDRELEMTKSESESKITNENGKVVVSRSSLRDTIIITPDTKGKLLSISDDEIKIQFDSEEDCSLSFEKRNGVNFFLATNSEKEVLYGKNEYRVNCTPHVLFKLAKRRSTTKRTKKAKGAW